MTQPDLTTHIGIALIGAIITIVTAFIGKIFWDAWSSSRVEKRAIYMTSTDCQTTRSQNCIDRATLFAYQAKTDIRIAELERQSLAATEEFKGMRKDLGEIKEALAGMKGILETKIQTITIKAGE